MNRSSRNFIFCSLILGAASCSAPRIIDFQPKMGPVGTSVTITGQRLASGAPLRSDVSINAVEQSVTSANPNEVLFTVADTTSSGLVKVATSKGADTSSEDFVVVREPEDASGGFTFEGDDGLRGEGVTTNETGQKVLIVALEPRWLNTGAAFVDVEARLNSHGMNMSNFWEEDSYGSVSFDVELLDDGIINLDKSYQYYYHGSRPRSLLSHSLPAVATFTDPKTLAIKNDGQDIEVEFETGDYTPAQLLDKINDALADADPDEAPPTFTAGLAGSKLSINTTIPREERSVIELSGDAISFLGFGSEDLFELDDGGPAIILFGTSVAKEDIVFPADSELLIVTQGSASTRVTFAAGETLDLSEVVTRIVGEFPGESDQQPFTVEAKDDPRDTDKAFLTISTIVDASDDDGFLLQVSGTAGEALGLASGANSLMGKLERYEPEISRGYQAIADGFNLYASSLPAGTSMESIFGDARIFVGSIIDPADNYRAFASGGDFNIQGDVFNVNFFTDSWNGSWQVFAHETGHALTFPDLYRVRSWFIGNPPGRWDIMDCSGCDAHTTSYLRAFAFRSSESRPEPWLESDVVTQLTPPSGSLSRTDRFILSPLESPWSSASINPFSVSHPGVPVVHAVQFIPSDDSDIYVAENRQAGVYRADHLGDTVDYSTSLPGSGVIFYQGRRTSPESAASFLPVNLLTPSNNALNTAGETFRQTITLLNGIDLRVVEVLPNPDSTGGTLSNSYLVESVWGEGSFYDVSINKWDPPPWETTDIWVDNRVENNWDVYTWSSDEDGLNPILNGDNVAVGETNRVYARIRNTGDLPIAGDIELVFKITIPQRVGDGAGSGAETEIGRTIISGGLDGRFGPTPEKQAYIEWRPRDTNQEHVCIKVYATPVPGELNATENNYAQENITQWYSETASPFTPVTFPIITENPFNDRTAQIRLRVPDVPLGWQVFVEDVDFVLDPGEIYRQSVTITPDLNKLMPQITSQGFADSFSANIQATTPIGDYWTVYGGITAVVHPVNKNSSITITPPTPGGGGGVTSGVIVSDGPLTPSMTNRVINIRYRSAEGEEFWQRVRADSSGQFVARTPDRFLPRPHTIKAFHSGGKGIGPLESHEISVAPDGVPGPIVPPPGGGVTETGGTISVP